MSFKESAGCAFCGCRFFSLISLPSFHFRGQFFSRLMQNGGDCQKITPREKYHGYSKNYLNYLFLNIFLSLSFSLSISSSLSFHSICSLSLSLSLSISLFLHYLTISSKSYFDFQKQFLAPRRQRLCPIFFCLLVCLFYCMAKCVTSYFSTCAVGQKHFLTFITVM